MIQELRIGNLVKLKPAYDHYAPKEDGIICIHELLKNKFSFEDRRFWYSHIDGIPLSPAILEKCGFELASDDETPYFGGYLLEITKGHKIRLRSKATWYTWTSQFGDIDFYYLHQLQNLYYSLTGTELTITL